jgi:hypothetical protein
VQFTSTLTAGVGSIGSSSSKTGSIVRLPASSGGAATDAAAAVGGAQPGPTAGKRGACTPECNADSPHPGSPSTLTLGWNEMWSKSKCRHYWYRAARSSYGLNRMLHS